MPGSLMTEVFGLHKDRLYITVYEDDDEAFRLWSRGHGVPAGRIFRFGKKDNFWAMGETGPCGPCSEIHYDLDPGSKAATRELIEKGSDRFIELWNLVFMQYEPGRRGGPQTAPFAVDRHGDGLGTDGGRPAGEDEQLGDRPVHAVDRRDMRGRPGASIRPATKAISPSASSPTTSGPRPF